MAELYKFKFDVYPTLLELYQEHKRLERIATKYSMSDSKSSAKKLLEANSKSNEFALNILAREIFEVFGALKPMLHKRRGEQGYFSWDEVFGDEFERLDENQKKCLVGLLSGKFVYELPLEYYNN